MTFSFSVAQQDVINSYLALNDYSDAYLYAADQAEGGAGVSEKVITWMRGAAGVNTHSTDFADFIWSYTKDEYFERFGTAATDAQIQTTSDNVALAFWLNISTHGWTFPDIDTVATQDAEAATSGLFDNNTGGWSGNPLFLFLDYDDAFDENILGTASDTYNALLMLHASDSSAPDIASKLSSLWNAFETVGLWSTAGALSELSGVDTFLDSAYGEYYEDFDAEAFSTPANTLFSNQSVGTTVTGTSADEVLVGSDGNDTFISGGGSDLIDGGGGNNTADFSSSDHELSFAISDENGLAAAFVGEVEDGSDVVGLFHINAIVGGSVTDTFNIYNMKADLSLDGSDGTDTLSAQSLTGAIFDTAAGTLTADSKTINFSNIEILQGGTSTQFLMSETGITVDTTSSDTAVYSDDYSSSYTISAETDGDLGEGVGVSVGGNTDKIFGIGKIKFGSEGDLVTVSSLPTSGITIDGGDGEEDDILDLSSLSDKVIDSQDANFIGFEQIQYSDVGIDLSSNSVATDHYLGSGDDSVYHVGPGSVIYSGAGNDVIQWSQGAAVADLSSDDRIAIGPITLHGGLRYKYSTSPYAEGLGGLVEYGIDSAGELVIHLPWLSDISVIGVGGVPVDVPPDMYVLNFSSNMDGFTGPGDITLAEYDIEAYNLWNAPSGINSVDSQIELLGLEIKTLAGTAFWGGQDPLVLDLDGDGFDLTYLTSVSKRFDLDADYYAEPSAWVLPDDGFLVRDIDGDGKITSGAEMFSSSGSGFDALASLDGNNDGVVNSDDDGLADFNGDGVVDITDQFSDLKVWVDLNQNGITDAGELHELSEFGIVQFDLTRTPDGSKVSGNTVTETATFERSDSTTGTIGEVLLAINNTDSVYVGPNISVTLDALAEPDIKGRGTLVSLHQALSENVDYIDDVDAAVSNITTPDLALIKAAILPILDDWVMGSPVKLPNGDVLEGDDANPELRDLIAFKDEEGSYVDYVYDVANSVTTISGIDHTVGTWSFASGSTVEIIGPDDSAIPDPTGVFGAYGSPTSSSTTTVMVDGSSETQNTYSYANGAQVIIVKPGLFADDLITGDTSLGNWDASLGPKLAFYERYMGETFPLNVKPTDAAGMNEALTELVAQIDSAMDYLAVRIAVQAGPLSDIFSGIHYDAASDGFLANGTQQLAPVYENLFSLAEGEVDPIAYLSSWKPFLDIVLDDFSQGDSSVLNTYGFLAQNIIGAYEAASPSFGLTDAAVALGIPSGLLVTGSGTIAGTDDPDIFYIDGSGQTAEGGKGADNYIVGQSVGTSVIDDEEAPLSSAEDTLRFTTLNASDITATRDGADLVLSVNGTDDTLTVVGEFTGTQPGLDGTGNLVTDYGVDEIVFADGTTWQKIQMAMAVSRVSPLGGLQEGTSATDYFISGSGDDTFEGFGSSDIYEIAPNTGNDTIVDLEDIFTRDSYDVVHFTGGVGAGDLTFSRDGASNTLTVGFVSQGGTVTIDDQFEATFTGVFDTLWMNQIELFAFDDGSMLSAQDIRDRTLSTYETTGNDAIYGFATNDTINGGAGNDFLSGGDGNDIYEINLGDGNDEIFDSNDNILSGQDDEIDFGSGITALDLSFTRVGASSDLLVGIGSGGQSVKIDGEFDAFDTGVFGVWWQNTIETLKFSDNSSLTYLDIISALITQSETSGNDQIYGFYTDDTLNGGTGNDSLDGGAGDDSYAFNRGYGNNVIHDDTGNDTVAFGTGIDTSDLIVSRDGDDAVIQLRDPISGVAGSEELRIAGQFDFWLNHLVENFTFSDSPLTTFTADDLKDLYLTQAKTTGADTIIGTQKSDTLDGGAGDDLLEGGDGDDTYLFDAGYGTDTIYDYNENQNYSSDDTVQFGSGIDPVDLKLVWQGYDLLISVVGTSDSLRVQDYFLSDLYRVESFTFTDSTIWDNTDVLGLVQPNEITGTSGADTITGTTGPDLIDGLGGTDVVDGQGGADIFVFDAGYGNLTIKDFDINTSSAILQLGSGIHTGDVSVSAHGDDIILKIGASDQVTIQGLYRDAYSGVASIVFDDTTVWTRADLVDAANAATTFGTTGNDNIFGSGNAERFDGLGGNDYIVGFGGNDTFVFNDGYGHLEISEHDGNPHSAILQLGVGINPSDVQVRGDYFQDIVLKTATSGDQITLDSMFDSDSYGVSEIDFADGTIWDRATILANAVAGTTGDDSLYGSQNSGEVFDGLGGNDYVMGGGDDDTFIFNSGYGHLEIDETDRNSSAENTLVFGSGISEADISITSSPYNVILTDGISGDQVKLDSQTDPLNWYGVQFVQFADGTAWNRKYLASNQVDGATGNDSLTGTSGADVLDGKGGTDLATGGGGNDFFAFNAGYGTLEVSEYDTNSSANNTLLFGGGISAEDLTVSTDGYGDFVLYNNVTEDVVLLDSEVYSSQWGVQAVVFADGTSWSRQDLLNTGIVGTSGNDALVGTSSSDIIQGKGGIDTIEGDGGNDTIIFNSGDGIADINEFDEAVGRNNVLIMGGGINPSDISVTADSYGDFILTNNVTDDIVVLDSEIYSSAFGVQSIYFDDGTAWTRQDLLDKGISGTSGNDTLTGTSAAEFFQGKGGVDAISGGGGADTYIFKSGDGTVSIDNAGGSVAHGLLEFSDEFSDEDLWFKQDGSDLVAQRIDSNDQVTISDWFGSDPSAKLSGITIDGLLEVDSQLNSLIAAMATYSSSNPSFDPTAASTMPLDTTLQTAIAASWHG